MAETPSTNTSSPLPPTPQDAPQTDATYERTRSSTSQNRSDASRPGPLPPGGAIKGDMNSEEKQGWDQAPTDIHDPQQQRHPRPDNVGGSERASITTNRTDRKQP